MVCDEKPTHVAIFVIHCLRIYGEWISIVDHAGITTMSNFRGYCWCKSWMLDSICQKHCFLDCYAMCSYSDLKSKFFFISFWQYHVILNFQKRFIHTQNGLCFDHFNWNDPTSLHYPNGIKDHWFFWGKN